MSNYVLSIDETLFIYLCLKFHMCGVLFSFYFIRKQKVYVYPITDGFT